MRWLELAGMAMHGVRRAKVRFVLTSLGVTIATAAIVAMIAFALGLQERAEKPFESMGLLNLVEVRSRDTRSADAQPPPVLDDGALVRFESIEGVELSFADFRANDLEVLHEKDRFEVGAMALPRELGVLGIVDDVILAGRYFAPGDEPEILLSQRLASQLGFETPRDALGASVRLRASGLSAAEGGTFEFRREVLPVTVVGVYTAPPFGPRFASRGLVLPIDLMRRIPGASTVAELRALGAGRDGGEAYGRAFVRVRNLSDVATVSERIRELGYRTQTFIERLDEMRAFFLLIDALLAAVGTVALVVAGLGIVNTMLMAVLERTREIGVHKALGATDGDVRWMFLVEAASVGATGGAAGIVLGWMVSLLMTWGIDRYALSQGVTAPVVTFAFPAWLLVGAFLFAVAVSIVAGVVPAARAARVDPIRALRGE